MLGADDRPEEFLPAHPVLREAVRRRTGYRIGKSGLVLEVLAPAVLEQKVVGKEAWRAWRHLLRALRRTRPRACSSRHASAARAGHLGLDSVLGVAQGRRRSGQGQDDRGRCPGRRPAGGDPPLPPDQADRRLQSLSGIGPWTSAEVRQRACGDPDAISVGDYHLPKLVGCALTGEPVDDAGMLELLAPYQGQRHRAADAGRHDRPGPTPPRPPQPHPRLPLDLMDDHSGQNRRSASELGVGPAAFERGPVNAITDVTGVRVGHTTLIEGASIRTGVTAIVPDAVDRAGGELPAGLYVGTGSAS